MIDVAQEIDVSAATATPTELFYISKKVLPDPGSGRQEHTAYAMGNRSSSFRDSESYLIYFWELLEWNQLLTSAVARLLDESLQLRMVER
jgi:hypothetical protein